MRKSRVLRWSGYVAFAVVFAIACAFLSHWQFDRNEQRERANALIAANYDAPPVSLGDVIGTDNDFDESDEWQSVELTGSYVIDEQLYVRNRPRGGTSAFEVLVPFQTTDGRSLLIDRGWVGQTEDSRPELAPLPPTGEVTITARLRPDEAMPRAGKSAEPGQVPTISIPLVQDQSSVDLIPGVYALMATESPAPSERPNAIDRPVEDPGPHLSYAIQWILFAVMGFVFIFYMIRTETKHRAEDAADAAAEREKKRKRDRDASEEDALLDA